jgi:hypothetical protein
MVYEINKIGAYLLQTTRACRNKSRKVKKTSFEIKIHPTYC